MMANDTENHLTNAADNHRDQIDWQKIQGAVNHTRHNTSQTQKPATRGRVVDTQQVHQRVTPGTIP